MLDKTFQPETVEGKWYDRWEKSGAFAADASSEKKPFTIMMPPPNVTGSLHIGHALNHTLQDILIRYQRMNGRDALWQPGTDHAGIATQMVVERRLEAAGQNRRAMGRAKFLQEVWSWKAESGGTIVGQLRRLGATPDWGRERFTMDEGLSKAVRKVFVQLYNEKLIYRDKRLVNWDPKLLTAVSDLEVEHREIRGKFYHFRYPYEDGTGYVLVATTRPETILADGAVAVNPDDDRYRDLVGKKVVVPIVNRAIPVIADSYVEAEFGSGAVKITAAHDFNDFEVYKRHPKAGIPLINLLTPDGKMNENCPPDYQGLDRFKAREKVIADFEALGLLDKVEDHVHQVPYGDRSGVVIEPYLTDQWYADTPTLAKPAIEAVRSGAMKFVPAQWENTYFHWMENQQPWCISRQLWWGHQIPAWFGPEESIFVAETEEEAFAEARATFGPDVELHRDEDVLDTWFSSALWPFSTLGWPDKTPELARYYPGDVLVTGFDIITFWVSRMMMMGLHFTGEVPFKTVYIHALVRDAKGQKMSKSKGNVIDPLDLIEKFGTDALRLTLTALAAQGRDIRLSEERVEGYRNFGTKLWNAARYCQMNGCLPVAGFDPAAVTHTLNQWIVGEAEAMVGAVSAAIEAYKFNDAALTIYHFVWGTLCDWYLEFTKPLLSVFNHEDKTSTQLDTPEATEIRATTGWVLDQVLHVLNPIMPFFTEELYAQMAERPKDAMLLTAAWPEIKGVRNEGAADEIGWLIRAISGIRSVRSDMNIPASAKLNLQVKEASTQTKQRLERYDDILRRMARLETVTHISSVPKGAIQIVLDESTLILPVADIIDLGKERARLAKEIERLNGEIKKIDQKLGNEQFVSNAPAEIIDEQKQRREDFSATMDKFRQALGQLEAA